MNLDTGYWTDTDDDGRILDGYWLLVTGDPEEGVRVGEEGN